MPLNGAPMPLVTYSDLTAPARSNPAMKVYQLVASRAEDRARPMPPDPTKRLKDLEIGELNSWAAAGAKPGVACTTTGVAGAGGSNAAAAGGGAVVDMPGATGANDADIEKCYELRAHSQPVAGDTTSYIVPVGENYSGFIFKAPWTQPVQGLRFRHLADNAAVLHHWLLFAENGPLAPDAIEECDLGGPTGFLCGQASTRSLITGWAPGRGDFRLPAGVGLELPAPGQLLAVEFHYFNTAAATAQDRSGVEICVTSKFRPNTATVTWLGTETINIPAQSAGTAAATCTPARLGMNTSDPIHVLFSWPHMHKLGTHMKSVVNRKGGAPETLYDGAFSFEFQVLYDTPMLLNPGDTVTTTCSYQNTTASPVAFGQSTTQEMCFNFAYAWPAHTLDNPGGAIGAASNTCFH